MRRSHSPRKCAFLVIAVSILLIIWLQITQAVPRTAELGRVARDVFAWLARKFLLGLSGTILFIALVVLWLLLCDGRRWLVSTSDSPPEESAEPGSAAAAATPEEVKADVQPAPESADTGATATATAPPGPPEERQTFAPTTVAGRIAMLVIFAALVLGDLWLTSTVSLTKPARENVGAALAYELAALEVLCVLFSMLAVFLACKANAGSSVSQHVVAPATPPLSDVEVEAMENEGESGLVAEAVTGEKDIERWKHSEEMV